MARILRRINVWWPDRPNIWALYNVVTGVLRINRAACRNGLIRLTNCTKD